MLNFYLRFFKIFGCFLGKQNIVLRFFFLTTAFADAFAEQAHAVAYRRRDNEKENIQPGTVHHSLQNLTSRTEMRAALPDQNTLNRRGAQGARLPGPAINAKKILKIAAAIDPINARAVVLNTGL